MSVEEKEKYSFYKQLKIFFNNKMNLTMKQCYIMQYLMGLESGKLHAAKTNVFNPTCTKYVPVQNEISQMRQMRQIRELTVSRSGDLLYQEKLKSKNENALTKIYCKGNKLYAVMSGSMGKLYTIETKNNEIIISYYNSETRYKSNGLSMADFQSENANPDEKFGEYGLVATNVAKIPLNEFPTDKEGLQTAIQELAKINGELDKNHKDEIKLSKSDYLLIWFSSFVAGGPELCEESIKVYGESNRKYS